MLKLIPMLQSQLNALCNCQFQYMGGLNPLLLRAYMMLLKDSLILYVMLHDCMMQLVDLFWKTEKTKAIKILKTYTNYVKETKELSKIYHNARIYFKELPKLKEADESIIESMENYVANNDDEGNKEKEDSISEDVYEEISVTTFQTGTSGSNGTNQLYQNEQNSESEESSGGDDVDHETDDFLKFIIKDFPSESFTSQPKENIYTPFSMFPPLSIPHSTATHEEKINFIKSIPQTDSLNTQGFQTLNPFQTMQQPRITNVNPFSDLVNPFVNMMTSNMKTNDQYFMPNTFTTKISNPFL